MPFLLLLVLSLVCFQRRWPAPADWLGYSGSVVVTWGVMALFVLAAWMAAGWWRHCLQGDGDSRPQIVHRYVKFRRWHACILVAVYFWLVCFGGWGWLISQGCVRGDIALPGTDLLLLSPLFVGLAFSWASYHSLEHTLAIHSDRSGAKSFPGRWSYVALHARQSFLLAAPPLVLMFLQQTVLAVWPNLEDKPWRLPVVGMVLLAGMYVGVPLLLRAMLGLKPLPHGPLRDRLLATARRLSFRFSDIVVWNTRGTVVNAMVTGPLPFLRYVILTDRLIEELGPDEIEAVFGHEVGHIKHQHLFFYFAFLLASLVAIIAAWELMLRFLQESGVAAWVSANLPWLQEWLQAYPMLTVLPLLATLGLYIFVVFGYLSRHCERQADIHGCRTANVSVFISALEKVARCNGISRDRPGRLHSWQHPTIAQRVAFLEGLQTDPTLEERFQRRVGMVKWAMVLVLAGLLLVLAIALGPMDVVRILGN